MLREFFLRYTVLFSQLFNSFADSHINYLFPDFGLIIPHNGFENNNRFFEKFATCG